MSSSVSAGGGASSSAASAVAAAAPAVPGERTLYNAAVIALKNDKPIFLDYFAETKPGGPAFIGLDESTGEKFLVKSADEYTSTIKKLYKVKDDIIVETENTIYIVSGAVVTKKISSSVLH